MGSSSNHPAALCAQKPLNARIQIFLNTQTSPDTKKRQNGYAKKMRLTA